MPGGRKRQVKKMQETQEKQHSGDEETTNTVEEDGGELTLHEAMLTISKQINGLHSELKSDLKSYSDGLLHEMNTLKNDINQQLSATKQTVQEHSEKLEEAQTRIEALEAWSEAAHSALRQSLSEQKKMVETINDLESRGKRNNLRIYGVREGEEGSSVIKFVENLIRSEKLIHDDMDPRIQRAHRSLAPPRSADSPPRSIIVNFLEFRVKETVLRNAWQKKILIQDKPIAFDHDYSTAVMQQRRAYKHVKSALKAKGVRFQSPFTKLRIHWDTGPQIYHNPVDAARDMRQRGFDIEEQQDQRQRDITALLDQLEQTAHWQRVQRHGDRGAITRVRERLQEFQHIPK